MSTNDTLKQQVLDWQLEQLGQGKSATFEDLPEHLREQVEKDEALTQALVFNTAFWQSPAQHEQPSEQLDANFYQMLDEAKKVEQVQESWVSAEPSSTPSDSGGESSSWWQSISDSVNQWLGLRRHPMPVGQFASFALVFALGYGSNQWLGEDTNSQGMAALEQQVASLSTVVALSMLQGSSASERLNGVAYSRSSDMSNPALQQQLLSLLANDQSTSVRLAVISSLTDPMAIASLEPELLPLALSESNPLVQLEIVLLLANHGSSQVRQALIQQKDNSTLFAESQELLQQLYQLEQI